MRNKLLYLSFCMKHYKMRKVLKITEVRLGAAHRQYLSWLGKKNNDFKDIDNRTKARQNFSLRNEGMEA